MIKIKTYITLLFAILLNNICYSQDTSFVNINDTVCIDTILSKIHQSGNLRLYQSDDLNKLMRKSLLIDKNHQGMYGYRVQISFSGSSQDENKERLRFINSYPEIPVYLVYVSPFFKVCAGNFRTRIEAQELLDKISKEYPSAFIIYDRVNYPEIKETDQLKE